jgi:hypothetical protein
MKVTVGFLNGEFTDMAVEMLKDFADASEEVFVTGVDGATYVVSQINESQKSGLEQVFAEQNEVFANGQMTLAIV